MAENQPRAMDLVRDMYGGGDPGRMNEPARKAHIERTLQENHDVLFRIYQFNPVRRLHMVIFRTAHPAEWMRVMQSRAAAPNQSFQLTKRRDVNNFFTITMSGRQEELQTLCEDFNQLHDQVMKSIQDEEAAAAATQGNPEDDVEELRERIRELELENRNLRGQ